MKISINNFKSIGSLANYEPRPLTILSGTNSSGKSSFIQLLLLLKQTLEIDSAHRPLDLDGKLFKVQNYIDILKEKKQENKLKVQFLFEKSELEKYRESSELSIYNAFENYQLLIDVEFDSIDKQIMVSSFSVKILTSLKSNEITYENKGKTFKIETNVAVFSNILYGNEFIINKINYSSFIPSDYEIELPDGTKLNEVAKLDAVKAILKDFFASLNYVGPLRQAPKDEYSAYGKAISVGTEGENVAETFHQLSENKISFYKIEEKDDVVSFKKSEDTFLNAVKYWLCERFKLCNNIYSKKESDNYVIYVESLSGVSSTIKHVGFGISQVLPVIVEGLRIGIHETLLIEQPEIHLHPKVQSNLTDFLISLLGQGKKVILETHSDHLITRLRRRIAEDESDELDDKTLLTFVEVGGNDVLFKNITINDYGVIELPFPEDFIERSDLELKAILKAQMKKRIKKQGK